MVVDVVNNLDQFQNNISEHWGILGNSRYSDIKWTHEVEKICSSGNGFIVGYADIFLKCIFKDKTSRTGNGFITLVIECKPKINSIGAICRQIKTYIKILGASGGYLCSYENIDNSFKKILSHEGIFFVKIVQPKEGTEARLA